MKRLALKVESLEQSREQLFRPQGAETYGFSGGVSWVPNLGGFSTRKYKLGAERNILSVKTFGPNFLGPKPYTISTKPESPKARNPNTPNSRSGSSWFRVQGLGFRARV